MGDLGAEATVHPGRLILTRTLIRILHFSGRAMTLSSKQEFLCWLAGTLVAIGLFIKSHTFYVTTATYCYGVSLFVVIAFLFWFRFRKRIELRPKWLTIVANVVLLALSGLFFFYLAGIATWYE